MKAGVFFILLGFTLATSAVASAMAAWHFAKLAQSSESRLDFWRFIGASVASVWVLLGGPAALVVTILMKGVK